MDDVWLSPQGGECSRSVYLYLMRTSSLGPGALWVDGAGSRKVCRFLTCTRLCQSRKERLFFCGFPGGRLPAVLREVQLDLVDPIKCKHVLQTLRGPGRPPSAMTVVCAGPERGGRDACQVELHWNHHASSKCPTLSLCPIITSLQGDSGGPLVCPAGPGGGHRVALGVTSWGKGCGRSWGNNSIRPPSRRGSPGVFTDVRLLLPWIKRGLRHGESTRLLLSGPTVFIFNLLTLMKRGRLLHHGKCSLHLWSCYINSLYIVFV